MPSNGPEHIIEYIPSGEQKITYDVRAVETSKGIVGVIRFQAENKWHSVDGICIDFTIDKERRCVNYSPTETYFYGDMETLRKNYLLEMVPGWIDKALQITDQKDKKNVRLNKRDLGMRSGCNNLLDQISLYAYNNLEGIVRDLRVMNEDNVKRYRTRVNINFKHVRPTLKNIASNDGRHYTTVYADADKQLPYIILDTEFKKEIPPEQMELFEDIEKENERDKKAELRLLKDAENASERPEQYELNFRRTTKELRQIFGRGSKKPSPKVDRVEDILDETDEHYINEAAM